MDKPLTGIRVLDLTRLLPGPYATLVLSDLGADVVKVEDPGLGDYLRGISAAMFGALNRGKRSIALDIRKDPATFRKLCERADVLVEGFRPGVFEKCGVSLSEFPRLITVRVSGYGQTGPWRHTAGHDVGYIALSGVLARTGAMPGVQIADFAGGFSTVIGVLAALVERARTGQGRAVDVALSDSAMQLLLPHLGGEENILDGSRPCYRVYACKDGRRYALGALEPKFWARFCGAVGRPQWEDHGFDTKFVAEVQALFATRTRDEWDALLRPVDCCGEPVVEADELTSHPQLRARELFVGEGMLRSVPAMVPTSELSTRRAPELGEHTSEVLGEWL